MLRCISYLHKQISRCFAAQQLPGVLPTGLTERCCQAARPRPKHLTTPQTRLLLACTKELLLLVLHNYQSISAHAHAGFVHAESCVPRPSCSTLDVDSTPVSPTKVGRQTLAFVELHAAWYRRPCARTFASPVTASLLSVGDAAGAASKPRRGFGAGCNT